MITPIQRRQNSEVSLYPDLQAANSREDDCGNAITLQFNSGRLPFVANHRRIRQPSFGPALLSSDKTLHRRPRGPRLHPLKLFFEQRVQLLKLARKVILQSLNLPYHVKKLKDLAASAFNVLVRKLFDRR
jgi:hypothetical protein